MSSARIERLIVENPTELLKAWNEYFAGERVRDVRFSEDTLSVDLADGRTITVPLVWYPRLLQAPPAQRANWRIAGAGYGIHWPDIDQDLSSEGLARCAGAAHNRRREIAPAAHVVEAISRFVVSEGVTANLTPSAVP